MKQSVTQMLDFFKKHKYGKASLVLMVLALLVFAGLIFRSTQQEQPIALSEVASAISAGRVVKVEDSLSTGTLTIYYRDGSKHIANRDTTAPFLEQMQYLGVEDSQLQKLTYRVAENGTLTGEKAGNLVVSIAMMGLAGFALFRLAGGGVMGARK